MSDEWSALRAAAAAGRTEWNEHALERALQREISLREVVDAIIYGEVIEVRADYRPFPRCLIFHVGELPLHVVAAY